MAQHQCLRCEHQWRSSSECPERCPRCKDHSYELPPGQTNAVQYYTQERLSCACGHTWIQRGELLPVRCPSDSCQLRIRNTTEELRSAAGRKGNQVRWGLSDG